MKLLVDCHVFDHAHEGSRTYILQLYKQLTIINKDIVFYFASYYKSNLEELLIEDNTHYVQLASKNKLYRLLFDFPRIIKRNSIDLAHFQYITPVFKTCKEIVTIHDILFKDFPEYFPFRYKFINNFLFRRSAKRSDLLLTVSDYSRKALAKHYDLDIESIYLTPNAVLNNSGTQAKSDVLKKYNLDKYILFVSRVEPRKNHLTLLKAFFELGNITTSHKLVFVGRFDFQVPELETYLNNLNEDDKKRIKWLQNVSDNELNSLYKKCSLFVYPSFAEGFGIPPLEASLHKVPVLCSNTSAMSEYTFYGDDLFNPHDKEEIKNKIENCLTQNINYGKLDTIKEKIIEKYSWMNSAIKFNSAIKNKLIG